MQRLHNGPVRSRRNKYQREGVGVTHECQLGSGLPGSAGSSLDALEHACHVDGQTCLPAQVVRSGNSSTHTRHLLYSHCTLSTHAYLASAADRVAFSPPARLQALVVRDEAVPAVAQQPAPLHVPAPIFMEPTGKWFFSRRGTPGPASILQFDSCFFKGSKLQSFIARQSRKTACTHPEKRSAS